LFDSLSHECVNKYPVGAYLLRRINLPSDSK